jgi:hypothetical protein
MLLLEGSISNFTRARYYFLCVEFSDFYVNQSLTGQTIAPCTAVKADPGHIEFLIRTIIVSKINYSLVFRDIRY